MVWRQDDRGHLAHSLQKLLDQVDAFAPDRDDSWDGSIGDDAHQARKSDHNLDDDGRVCALDITHDPAHGVDAQQLADQIRASRDPRVAYLIHAGRISNPDFDDWAWRPRNKGDDDHAHHVHVSVRHGAIADDARAWQIRLTDKSATPSRRSPLKQGSTGAAVRELQALLGVAIDGEFGPDTLAAVKAFQAIAGLEIDGIVGSMTWARLLEAKKPAKLQENIKATVFNDGVIAGTELAYPDADPRAPGVALPAPFPGVRPLVWVRNRGNGMVAVLEIADKGPWYDGTPNKPTDAYWELNRRPRAESDPNTNHAGIDLNVAAADLLGVAYTLDNSGRVKTGEAQLDWGFLPEGAPAPQPQPVPEPTDLASAIAAMNKAAEAMRTVTAAMIGAVTRLEQLATRLDRPPSPSNSLVPKPPAPQQQVLPPLPFSPAGQPNLEQALPLAAELLSGIIGMTPQGQALKGAATVLQVLGELAKRRQP